MNKIYLLAVVRLFYQSESQILTLGLQEDRYILLNLRTLLLELVEGIHSFCLNSSKKFVSCYTLFNMDKLPFQFLFLLLCILVGVYINRNNFSGVAQKVLG